MTKLNKQLADSVNLETNTVIIKGVEEIPREGILYLVKDASVTVSDIYKEYTIIENQLTLIGDTRVSLDGYATEEYVEESVANVEKYLTDYAKKEDIPDVSSFIAEIPEEYITESELQEKEYLTQAALTDYAKKSDIPDVSSFLDKIPPEYVTESELELKGYCTEATVFKLLNEIEFIDGGTSATIMI